MKSTRTLSRGRSALGFSMVEIIATVSLLAIIATVAVIGVGSTQNRVRSAKLKSDVQKLNEVVSVYLASGGSLSGISDPQEVLNELKTKITKEDATRNVGVMTGRGVDARLKVRLQSNSEAGSSDTRALWDSASQKFYVSTSGKAGICAFELDNELAGSAAAYEKRTKSNELYNGAAGWVWENSDNAGPDPLATSRPLIADQENKYNPTAGSPSAGSPAAGDPTSGSPATTTPPGTSGSTGSGSTPTVPPVSSTDPAAGAGAGAAAGLAILPPPIISPPGGAFFGGQFPSAIYINPNGAPSSSSFLKYRLNDGGPWTIYTGPFAISSGTKVTAQNFSSDPTIFANSPATVETYYSLVASFTGIVAAKWNASSGPSGLKSVVNNTNPNSVVETNGTAATNLLGQNTFTFNREASFTGVPPNTPFKIGQLVYHNGTIWSGTGSTALNLHLDVTLTSPSAGTTGSDISMKLDNTKNVSGGNNAKSADSCTLANPVTNYTVTIGGITYSLVIKYGSIDSSEGYVDGNTLNVWEGATGHADILAVFASTVPSGPAPAATPVNRD